MENKMTEGEDFILHLEGYINAFTAKYHLNEVIAVKAAVAIVRMALIKNRTNKSKHCSVFFQHH
jgi:hypothetical protein